MIRILILLSLLFSSVVFAQETADSVAKSYQLPSDQYKAWKIIEDEWMKKEYPKILKENKLKMTCSGCENIFMDVVMAVDASGNLKYYKIIKTRKCSGEFSKKLQERFMKWFSSFLFPEELYNTKFEARLGTGLKC